MMIKIDKKYRTGKNDLNGMEIEDSVLSVTEKEAGMVELLFDKKLLDFFWWLIVATLLIMAGRVFYLSVIEGEYYKEVARENRVRSITIKAPRGKIYDRFQRALVQNVPSLDVTIVPSDLPKDSSERKIMAGKLSQILKMNEGDIWGILENLKLNSLEPVLLKENITQEEALIMLEGGLGASGIRIEKSAIRNYIDSSIFSHILGYEGKIKKEELIENPDYLLTDYIGKQGLEKSYEKYLRGVHGSHQVEVDSLGRTKREIDVKDPIPGSDLVLNINMELQKKIFDSLSNILEKEEIKSAAAVAIDPQDGGVLAIVSLPSFDNNLFANGISGEDYRRLISDSSIPMFNRAISGEYPPGSTIKPLIASAALTEGVVDENTRIESRGGIQVGSWFFGDWKVHGFTNIKEAIAVSSDVFFYSVGGGYGNIRGMGMGTMKKYEDEFGLGKLSNIDIPGEKSGFIPDEKWKEETLGEKWYIGNSYHASIGQGYITSTPLQIANYISAIANDGKLFKPRLVSQIKKPNGETINNPPKVVNDNFISKEVLKIVREGMRLTVTEGTAKSLNDLSVEVAGKTGTAQYGAKDETHGWFVSFAPYEDPDIVLAVLIEGQTENTYNAVPVTKEVYNWYFEDNEE